VTPLTSVLSEIRVHATGISTQRRVGRRGNAKVGSTSYEEHDSRSTPYKVKKPGVQNEGAE
jgi:hypothetical protein